MQLRPADHYVLASGNCKSQKMVRPGGVLCTHTSGHPQWWTWAGPASHRLAAAAAAGCLGMNSFVSAKASSTTERLCCGDSYGITGISRIQDLEQ